jgi:two-component system chemotaxis sensor kinase CheA
MRRRLLEFIILPSEVTRFERDYLHRINRIAFSFFLVHLPVLTGIAFLTGTDPALAAGLCVLTQCGPLIAYLTFQNPRHLSLVFGLTSVFMGTLLVHFGQGPMQIEMHFYFLVSLALMSVFANPAVIILAALAVVMHHLFFFFFLPRSVFNYEASLWAVAVHAIFVVLAMIATSFIARSFFDNVVGLEKIVLRRTQELNSRNRDLRLILDNVSQGFLTADTSGALAPEHSRIIETWLGPVSPGMRIWEYLGTTAPELRREIEDVWQNLGDGILAVDAVLDALPKRMEHQGRQLQLDYKPIESTSSFLVVVSDITAQLDRQRFESEQRELIHLFQGIAKDRAGFLEFFAVAQTLVRTLSEPSGALTLEETYRAVHTLKGNAALFGVSSVASVCHDIEGQLRYSGALEASARSRLLTAWERAAAQISGFLGPQRPPRIMIDEDEHLEVLAALRAGVNRVQVAQMIESWKDEPAAQRLNRIADQARALADRMGKGLIDVSVDAGRLRLPRAQWSEFWGSFVHVVRNAVDHGLEGRGERVARGKHEQAQLRLKLERVADQVRLTISDDGRGLDWDAVRRAATALGLPTETRAQLEEALFFDGLTTSTAATAMSGRGIGMGATRAACQRMGGTIHIRSEPGRGTEVEFRFPCALGMTTSQPRLSAPVQELVVRPS